MQPDNVKSRRPSTCPRGALEPAEFPTEIPYFLPITLKQLRKAAPHAPMYLSPFHSTEPPVLGVPTAIVFAFPGVVQQKVAIAWNFAIAGAVVAAASHLKISRCCPCAVIRSPYCYISCLPQPFLLLSFPSPTPHRCAQTESLSEHLGKPSPSSPSCTTCACTISTQTSRTGTLLPAYSHNTIPPPHIDYARDTCGCLCFCTSSVIAALLSIVVVVVVNHYCLRLKPLNY